jgi:hypothetical protein
VLTLNRLSRLQFQLRDIVAVMVGYGMAALLFRAFWPDHRPSAALAVAASGFYLWLGMAMSGPVLLLRGRPSPPDEPPAPGQAHPEAGPHSWAELAWSLIGGYWIIFGLVVIPTRLREFKLGDMLLFGLVPIVVAVALRLFSPRLVTERERKRGWTHTAAVVLVATWPAAWVCLILLGMAMH